MLERITVLYSSVVANLANADELGLTDVGIRLDQARLHLEDELSRLGVLGAVEAIHPNSRDRLQWTDPLPEGLKADPPPPR